MAPGPDIPNRGAEVLVRQPGEASCFGTGRHIFHHIAGTARDSFTGRSLWGAGAFPITGRRMYCREMELNAKCDKSGANLHVRFLFELP